MLPYMHKAFTLVELLMVFTIIALIAGMMLAGLHDKGSAAQVRPAAEELAGVLRRARSLAISTMHPHAVVFNISNARGSSGRILNNLEGGHWYRILGPVLSSSNDTIPSFQGVRWFEEFANFGDFIDSVEASWIGEAHVLPAGKVRFLALADTDEGMRSANQMTNPLTGESFYASSGESPSTYPRPWFGYYDSVKLHAWGGYDPDNPATRMFSGFCFQGGSTVIPKSLNPADKIIVSYPCRSSEFCCDAAGTLLTGVVAKPRKILAADQVRPLVNALWRDVAIVFLPDGRAQMLPWNEARARYYDCDPILVKTPSVDNGKYARAGGLATSQGSVVAGTATLTTVQFVGGSWSKIRDWYRDKERVEEAGSFHNHTGGWFFTLGPDVTRERVMSGVNDNVFGSSDEALRSMLPSVRIFVSKAGLISIVPVARRDQMPSDLTLSGLPTWPPTNWSTGSGYWNDVETTFNQNDLAMNIRWGWLHNQVTAIKKNTALKPRGVPIVHSVGVEMLTKRIWWVDPPTGTTWTEP